MFLHQGRDIEVVYARALQQGRGMLESQPTFTPPESLPNSPQRSHRLLSPRNDML